MDTQRATVIRTDPVRQRRRRLLLWAIVLAVFAIGVALGRHYAPPRVVALNDERGELREQIQQMMMRRDIDLEALATLRADLAEARAVGAELGRELSFYREVLAPEDVSQRIVLRQPVMMADGQDNLWRYQVVVQQGKRGDTVYKGSLAMFVDGEYQGQAETLALDRIDSEMETDAFTLSFRYFQRFQGQLQLPEGFTAKALRLEASLTRPARETFSKRFDWSELTNNVRGGVDAVADEDG